MIHFDISPAQEFLCLCTRHIDHIDSSRIALLYGELGDTLLFQEASKNGVTSIVAHSLSVALNDRPLPPHWNNEYEQVETRIASYMSELDRIASLLDEHGIKLLALKNSGIARGMYPHLGACPMGDLDVLVNKEQFREAHSILIAAGYVLKFRCEFEEDSIEAAEEGGGAEYSVTLPNGEHLWFELQWRPVAGRWIQPSQEPKASELVNRAIPISNSKVWLLSPEDNLLQVALHTAKHTFVRAPGFRLHTDVDRIVSTQSIDWDLFVERVLLLRTKTAVYLSLAMAQSLLGTTIPPHVLDTLKPPEWKVRLMVSWLQRVGIFEPDGKKWGKLGYIAFVSLLYDDSKEFVGGVIPNTATMKQHYHFQSSWLLPYFHTKRLSNLLLKRINT